MLVPLVILAVLSVCGGWMGSARFERFLAPVFFPHTISHLVAGGSPEAIVIETRSEQLEHLEMMLTVVSVTAAGLGLFLAWLLYQRRPRLPQEIALALGGFYEAVVHKYYVDELYAVLLVNPLVNGSTKLLWHGIDRDVIDATLDNSADAARSVSDTSRHMQSGNIRSYAGWVAAGAAAVIAYMVWMGTR